MHRPKPCSRLREEDVLEEQKQPFVEKSLHQDEKDGPDFDAASATRSGCIATVSTGVILSLVCLISGIYLLRTNQATLGASASISTFGREAMALAINVILTLCTDGMMFVHSVSLRWALYREGRLEFNTNIRLFTSSKRFGPNKSSSILGPRSRRPGHRRRMVPSAQLQVDTDLELQPAQHRVGRGAGWWSRSPS